MADIKSQLEGIGLAPSLKQELDTIGLAPDLTSQQKLTGIEDYIDEASADTGLPRSLIRAVIDQESGGNPKAVSPVGAIGYMQLMPQTAKELGVDPNDPRQNVLGGARYLKTQIDTFGNVEDALAAYNAGPHRVTQYGGIPPFAETQAYVPSVLKRFDEYQSKDYKFQLGKIGLAPEIQKELQSMGVAPGIQRPGFQLPEVTAQFATAEPTSTQVDIPPVQEPERPRLLQMTPEEIQAEQFKVPELRPGAQVEQRDIGKEIIKPVERSVLALDKFAQDLGTIARGVVNIPKATAEDVATFAGGVIGLGKKIATPEGQKAFTDILSDMNFFENAEALSETKTGQFMTEHADEITGALFLTMMAYEAVPALKGLGAKYGPALQKTASKLFTQSSFQKLSNSDKLLVRQWLNAQATGRVKPPELPERLQRLINNDIRKAATLWRKGEEVRKLKFGLEPIANMFRTKTPPPTPSAQAAQPIAQIAAPQQTMRQQLAAKPKIPEEVRNPVVRIEKAFAGEKSPQRLAEIERIKGKTVDRLLPQTYKAQDVTDVANYARENNVPFAFIRGDGRELKAWNTKNKNIRPKTDEEIKQIWGVYEQGIVDAGGIIGRDQGDEFWAVIPNATQEEANALIDELQVEVQPIIDRLGLADVPSSKPEYNKLPIGTGTIDMVAIDGLNMAPGELERSADEVLAVVKEKAAVDKAKEIGYNIVRDQKGEIVGYEPKTVDEEIKPPRERIGEPVSKPSVAKPAPRGPEKAPKPPTEPPRVRETAKPTEVVSEKQVSHKVRPVPKETEHTLPRPTTPPTEIKEQPNSEALNFSEEMTGVAEPNFDPVLEGGFVTIPDPTTRQKIAAKITKIFDTEAPYRAMGAPETGFHVKNIWSRFNAGDEKAQGLARDIVKSLPDKGKLRDAFFLSINPKHGERVGLSSERLKELEPVAKNINKLTEEFGQELLDRKVLKDLWPQSAINRNEGTIRQLEQEKALIKSVKWSPRTKVKAGKKGVSAAVKVTGGEKRGLRARALKEIDAQIKQLSADNEKLSQLRYLHFPARIWLEDKYTNDPEAFRSLLSANFSGIKGRKTIDPYDLVEAKILDPDKVNAAEAVAVYVRYIEHQKAQADIRDAAIREGIVKPFKSAPGDWVKLGEKYPIFAGKKVHPVFAELLSDTFESLGTRASKWEQGMAIAKMLQFYNPIIMPMYDTFQGAALTQGRFLQPKRFAKSVVDAVKKTPRYWEAYENGLFSQPYRNPMSQFKKDLNDVMESADFKYWFKNEIERVKSDPVKAVLGDLMRIPKDLYSASWNTAWWGDKIIRMSSYNAMRDLGFSARDAAQLAAEAHADYAGVPVKTRKALNKVFFTPTFQISMLKWYANMSTSAAKVPLKTLGATLGKKQDKIGNDILRTASLATALGILAAMDYGMRRALGWEREEFARKYTKTVKYTDEKGKEQEKEVVVTFSNPLNVPLKYYYTFIKPKPGLTKTEQISKYGRFWLHPLYKMTLELGQNKRADGTPIANPWSSTGMQAVDVSRYMASQMFSMYRGLIDESENTKEEAYRTLKKGGANPFELMLKPITFMYLRQPKEEAIKRRASRVIVDFSRALIDRPPRSKKELDTMFNKVNSVLDDLKERAVTAEAKEVIQQSTSTTKATKFVFDSEIIDVGKVDKATAKELKEQVKAFKSVAREDPEAPSGWRNKANLILFYKNLEPDRKKDFVTLVGKKWPFIRGKVMKSLIKQPHLFSKKSANINAKVRKGELSIASAKEKKDEIKLEHKEYLEIMKQIRSSQ